MRCARVPSVETRVRAARECEETASNGVRAHGSLTLDIESTKIMELWCGWTRAEPDCEPVEG